MSIKFYEKEPKVYADHPYYGTCMMYPVVMLRDNKEYIVLERRVPQPKQADALIRKILDRLKQNDGIYAMYFGENEDLEKFLTSIIDQKKWFNTSKQILKLNKENKTLRFSGSVYGQEKKFLYYIYDYNYACKITKTIKLIQAGKFSEAAKALSDNTK